MSVDFKGKLKTFSVSEILRDRTLNLYISSAFDIKPSNKIRFNRYYILNEARYYADILSSLIKIELDYGVKFLLSTLMAICGVVAYFAYDLYFSIYDLLVIYFALAFSFFLMKTNKIANIICILIFSFLLGFTCSKFEDWRYSTHMLGGIVRTHIVAELLQSPLYKGNKYQLLLKIVNYQPKYIPKIVKVTSYTMPTGIRSGSYVNGDVVLFGFGGKVTPDSYDFPFYNYFSSVGASGYFIKPPNIEKHTVSNGSILTKIVDSIECLREIIVNRIKTLQNNEEGSIAAAMIVGDRSGISKETNDALRKAGLAHVLAISGLHMSMVTGILFLTVRWLLALNKYIAYYYPIKKIAAVAAISIALGYFILSGITPSSQRSFIMAEVIFLAIILDKRTITIRNLALSVWVAIIIQPHELMSPSFQMSFSAAGSLIALYLVYKTDPVLADVDSNHSWFYIKLLKFKNMAIETLKASFIAGFASGVFALYNFGNIAPFAMFSNLLAGGLISLVIMPFALLTVVSMPFSLEALPLHVLVKGISGLKYIAFFISNITPQICIKYINSETFAILSLGMILVIILRTRLRLLGVAVFLLGAIQYYYTPIPLVVVSEDGKHVAIFPSKGYMAVSSNRLNNFTFDNWKRAFMVKNIIKSNESTDGFVCNDNLCRAVLPNKDVVYVVKSAVGKEEAINDKAACKIFIMSYNDCDSIRCNNFRKKDIVITKHDLATHGALEIFANHRLRWSYATLRSWSNYRYYQASKYF